jgi:hypothetical protein
MSNAIAQSTASQTVSGTGEDNFDFALHVRDAASRQAKGVTRERQMLNRQKLISAVCAIYRAKFAAIYGKTDRLPSEVFTKIDTAVDEHINKTLTAVNPANVITFRRAFFHNANDMMITERVQATGENQLTLKEQLCGVTIFIEQTEKRLKELEAKKTPDFDREKAVKAQLMRLNVTRDFIKGEMKHQGELVES